MPARGLETLDLSRIPSDVAKEWKGDTVNTAKVEFDECWLCDGTGIVYDGDCPACR